MVSRCLLLPFTLEVNSSSWQATFIALLVLRGDNHHVRSLALGKKWGSGTGRQREVWDQGEQRDPSSHNGEESSQDRVSHKSSSGVQRVRGEGTPTFSQGRSLGVSIGNWDLKLTEGSPTPPSPWPQGNGSLTTILRSPHKTAAYSSRFSFRLPPQTPQLPFFLYLLLLPFLPRTLYASSPGLP